MFILSLTRVVLLIQLSVIEIIRVLKIENIKSTVQIVKLIIKCHCVSFISLYVTTPTLS